VGTARDLPSYLRFSDLLRFSVRGIVFHLWPLGGFFLPARTELFMARKIIIDL
jgi:hypothetical protein